MEGKKEIDQSSRILLTKAENLLSNKGGEKKRRRRGVEQNEADATVTAASFKCLGEGMEGRNGQCKFREDSRSRGTRYSPSPSSIERGGGGEKIQ